MHATFLDCGVCHAVDARQAETAHWLSLENRKPQSPPAVLRLARLLEEVGDVTPALRSAVNNELIGLRLVNLKTTHPQSAVWEMILQRMRQRIRFHVHGEYNAKIALFKGGRQLGTLSEEQRATARRLRTAGERLSPEQRQTLEKKVHEGIVPAGLLCTPCHSPESPLLDLARLGYPASRVESLQRSEIVDQVLRIEQGEPFYLPQIVDESARRAKSQ